MQSVTQATSPAKQRIWPYLLGIWLCAIAVLFVPMLVQSIDEYMWGARDVTCSPEPNSDLWCGNTDLPANLPAPEPFDDIGVNTRGILVFITLPITAMLYLKLTKRLHGRSILFQIAVQSVSIVCIALITLMAFMVIRYWLVDYQGY